MRRRHFIEGVAALVACPLAARAQSMDMPTVGVIMASSRDTLRDQIATFEATLKEIGFVKGQNLSIEYRFAEGQLDRLPAFVSDLISRKVSMLVVASPQGSLIAKRATFSMGADPVVIGLVPSLNHPGSNVTGVYQFTTGLEEKRLSLLHEMVPKVEVIGVLINPNYSAAGSQLHDVKEAADRLGLKLIIARANAESEFDAAFSTFAAQRAGALLVCASPFFNTRRQQLVVLATSHGLPAIFEWRDFVVAGGLMSYGTSLSDAYRSGWRLYRAHPQRGESF